MNEWWMNPSGAVSDVLIWQTFEECQHTHRSFQVVERWEWFGLVYSNCISWRNVARHNQTHNARWGHLMPAHVSFLHVVYQCVVFSLQSINSSWRSSRSSKLSSRLRFPPVRNVFRFHGILGKSVHAKLHQILKKNVDFLQNWRWMHNCLFWRLLEMANSDYKGHSGVPNSFRWPAPML